MLQICSSALNLADRGELFDLETPDLVDLFLISNLGLTKRSAIAAKAVLRTVISHRKPQGAHARGAQRT
jgi:hypothetical protein